MLFDLASCTGPQASTCQPKTCADLGYDCGDAGDGCDDGVVLHCGACANGRTCGGGGSGQCGTGPCSPGTCASLAADCGIVGDGCGGTVECGTCPSGEFCGTVAPPISVRSSSSSDAARSRSTSSPQSSFELDIGDLGGGGDLGLGVTATHPGRARADARQRGPRLVARASVDQRSERRVDELDQLHRRCRRAPHESFGI